MLDCRLPSYTVDELAALLDPEERERAAALSRPGLRAKFIAAHAGARLVLGRHLGAPPGRLRWVRGPHGKPELAWPPAAPRVSLSHSGELATVAACATRPLGVDLQRLLRGADVLRIAQRFFPPDQARLVVAAGGAAARQACFATLWTRKEACVKAAGGRLAHGLPLPVAGHGRGLVVRGPAAELPGPYRVRDLPAPAGFRAAVAVVGADRYRVVLHGPRPVTVTSRP
jgi:4'-phosphopantetheinyl transferase